MAKKDKKVTTISDYTASIFGLEGKTALVTMTGAIIPLDGGINSARTLGLEQGL